MKDRIIHKESYQRLIQTIYLKTVGLIGLAIGIVLLLRHMVHGKFGNLIVHFLSAFYRIKWEDAQLIYFRQIRSNMIYILLVTMLIFFLFFFRLLLGWFMRYFDQIIEGIDQLTEETNEQITMEPELSFAAQKLNVVKGELTSRAREKQEAEKKKDELVVYLAHDIRTPLTSVIGYLNLIEESDHLTKEQLSAYIQISLKKANQLEKLINELFEITRYNAQAIVLHKEWIDLSYMMIQLIDEAFPILREKGKTAKIDIPDNIKIFADPDKMARVFHNILRNDIMYAQEGSTIQIWASENQEDIDICFESVGTISKDKLDKIFDKFYRGDDARQTATGGAGLGLAIAKNIVELHGGTIKASCNQDRTIFCVSIPAK